MRGGDGVHHPIPHACFPPSNEAVAAGGARAVTLRQVAPRRTRTQHPEDAVQHTPVIDARHASRLVRQQRFDHAPLDVGQVISANADAESELLSKRKGPALTRRRWRTGSIAHTLPRLRHLARPDRRENRARRSLRENRRSTFHLKRSDLSRPMSHLKEALPRLRPTARPHKWSPHPTNRIDRAATLAVSCQPPIACTLWMRR